MQSSAASSKKDFLHLHNYGANDGRQKTNMHFGPRRVRDDEVWQQNKCQRARPRRGRSGSRTVAYALEKTGWGKKGRAGAGLYFTTASIPSCHGLPILTRARQTVL